MSIPDEAANRFPESDDHTIQAVRAIKREGFIAGAEWARKEALREAEAIVRPTYRFEHVTGPTGEPIQRANWTLHHAADRIAAL